MGERDHHTIDEGNSPERTQQLGTGGEPVVPRRQESVVMQWTKCITALFALIGLGFGLLTILLDAAGQDVVDATGQPGFETAFGLAALLPITGTPYFALVGAVFVGALLGWYVEYDNPTTYRAAGVGTAVGTVVFWVLATFFGTVPFEAVSVDLGGLLVNALIAGIVVGFVAAGGVWAVRTLTPDRVDLSREPTRDDGSTKG